MPRQSYATLIVGWGRLNRSVQALETKEPFVEERRKELDAALAEAIRLRAQCDRLLGRLQTTSEQLQEVIARGKQAESRLRMLLRGTYGPSNPQLIRHGINPRRAPRRKKRGGEEETPAPESAALEQESQERED
jgi:hypothetical protein